MAADFPFRDYGPRAVPLADLSAGVLDPVLRKRADEGAEGPAERQFMLEERAPTSMQRFAFG